MPRERMTRERFAQIKEQNRKYIEALERGEYEPECVKRKVKENGTTHGREAETAAKADEKSQPTDL